VFLVGRSVIALGPLTALALGVAGGVAAVAPAGAAAAGATPTAAAPAVKLAAPGRAAPTRVRLLTGDVVELGTTSAGATTLALPSGFPRGGALTARTGAAAYVLPRALHDLIGTRLDPGLFDVRAIAASRGRMPVDITYAQTTSATAVAGVEVTSRNGLSGKGFVTEASSRAFGAALAKNTASALLANVSSVRPIAKPTANPAWPMFTLTTRVTGADSRGLNGVVFAFNVDNPDKGGVFLGLTNGVAKASVPTGRYLLLAMDNAADGTAMIAQSSDFTVTSARSVTLDVRSATTPVTVNLGVPNIPKMFELSLERSVGTVDYSSSVSFGTIGDGMTPRLLVTPTAVGTQARTALTNSLLAYSPTGQQAGRYAVSAGRSGPIPNRPVSISYDPKTFARIDSTFYGPNTTRRMLLRAAADANLGGWSFGSLLDSSRRVTEFVSTGPNYSTHANFMEDVDAQLGQIESEWRSLPSPRRYAEDWAKEPIHTGIFSDPAILAPDPMICFACLDSSKALWLYALQRDTFPLHILYADPDTVAWSVRADARTIASGTDYLITEPGVPVPMGTTVLTATLDVDRGAPYRTGTHLRTILTVPMSAARPIPAGWQCAGTGPCQVLPMLYADYNFPVRVDGTLPAGRRTLTLTLHQVGLHTPALRSVRVETAYGAGWVNAPVTALGGGRYAVTLTIPSAGPGRTSGDLRVSAVAMDGTRLDETITAAYRLAP